MKSGRVPIRATETLQQIMIEYYMEAKMAEGTKRKLAWVTSGAPVEILYAADVIPLYPENHAALCGARKVAVELCSVAEDHRFSRDLCSYARTDFGSIYGGTSPIGGLPKPDFLLCCNNICGTVTKWYQHLERELNVPLIFIDVPFEHDGVSPEAIAYVRKEIENAITAVGEIIGKPIDMDRFRETLTLSFRSTVLWGEVLDLLAHRPSPMSAFDAFVHMALVVVMKGTQKCIGYYEKVLIPEIKQRVADGIAAVPGERFRLGWDNIAIWFKLRELSIKFAEHKACLAAATYTHEWAAASNLRSSASTDDPLNAMAEVYASAGYINSGIETRTKTLLKMAEKFSLDGFVMHSDRSCKAYSLMQYDLAKILAEESNIPVLIIEADHCDSRAYADEQINTRIDAFMETLAGRAPR